MKRNLIVLTLLLICILVILPTLSSADEGRRDGNWWREQGRNNHFSYVVGFFDGMDLGHKFSYWKFIGNKKTATCFGPVTKSYEEYCSKYFNHVTNVQIVDGLDSFYEDYKNRSIQVCDAVWLVVNGIAGTPQEKLDKMIENWRRSAAQ